MQPFNSKVLLENLMADVREIILEAKNLENVDSNVLQVQPAEGKWSVAQVIAHLNFYSSFYIKTIEDKLHRHNTQAKELFRPGWFGNYFTKMMKPSDDQQIKNRMKTMKKAIPPAHTDGRAALQQFLRDQHQLLNLLQVSAHADLNSIRIPLTITNLLTLKLGDTFRFFVAHEQRHMLQIKNTLALLVEEPVNA